MGGLWSVVHLHGNLKGKVFRKRGVFFSSVICHTGFNFIVVILTLGASPHVTGEVLNAVTYMYMFPEDEDSLLPQPDEVLLCTDTTTFEQVGPASPLSTSNIKSSILHNNNPDSSY